MGSGINWLDAQSSCAIWGGDLTSITTERENNYLNTLITSSVGNCWIGLNDRDVEGIYTWIDGTAVSYTNWTSTPSDDTNSNCVQINNAGNGIWESVSCGATLNAFLCKRDESSTVPQGLLHVYIVSKYSHTVKLGWHIPWLRRTSGYNYLLIFWTKFDYYFAFYVNTTRLVRTLG